MAPERSRVLLVDDPASPYAMTVQEQLGRSGHDPLFRLVFDVSGVEHALADAPWDVIVADYSMPDFRAAAVLSLLKARQIDIPVVVVSENLGEEVAVAAMKAGAHDYLLKGNVSRLVPTLERALRETAERKRAAAALRESEQRYSAVVAALDEGVVVYDAAGVLRASNPGAERILGRSAVDLIGGAARDPRWSSLREDLSVFPAEEHPVALSLAGRSCSAVILGMRRPDGELRWVSMSTSPLFLPGATSPYAVVASFMDITDRKRAEQDLREREASFHLLFASNPQPMWVLDSVTGRFLEVNEAALEHYGYRRSEFLGMCIGDIVVASDAGPADADPAPAGQPTPALASRHRVKNGKLIDVEITSHALDFQGARAELVVAYDVTERKALEARLLQSQKMEAVGHLAGGIAHDFNNLLNVIIGYCEMLLKSMRDEDQNRRRVEQTLKAAGRAAVLTQQLLAFSRKQVLQPKVLEMNTVVIGIEEMLQRVIGEQLVLRTALGSGLGRVKADPGQLEQVLVNLAVNARDAMRKGGTLIIETRNVDLDQSYVSLHPDARPGPHVMLAVSDTGHGMDAETRRQIFEPFFTTKEKGRGTGLGLATVYGIVKQSGGHIEVYSELGVGSSFKVYLPQTAELPEVSRPERSVPRAEGGRPTLLLVEDDAHLRDMLAEILREAGYSVLEASKPTDALALSAATKETVDVVLTDVIMPGMSGREMEARLLSARPGTPILYMSGYTDEAIDQHGVLDADAHFIQKPFTTPALLEKLRSVVRGG